MDRIASVSLVQWSKPAILAGAVGAAFVVACGALFVEKMLTPAPARPALAETTGHSSVQDPADCQTQTWPHIARPCLSNEDGARGVRMISTDKLTEPAISIVEKPPANMIHKMVPPPAPKQPAPLISARAVAPVPQGPPLNAIAFNGRFEGTPATEKFEPAQATAAASKPSQQAAEPEKSAVRKAAVQTPAKQKAKRRIARVSDKPSGQSSVASREDVASNRSSFNSTPGGFFSRGPFGGLFGN